MKARLFLLVAIGLFSAVALRGMKKEPVAVEPAGPNCEGMNCSYGCCTLTIAGPGGTEYTLVRCCPKPDDQ